MTHPHIDISSRYHDLMNALEPSRLSMGDAGLSVTYLQGVLQLLNYYTAKVDGDFGTETAQAITQLQQYFGFQETGCFDFEIWYALSFWVPEELGWKQPHMNTHLPVFTPFDQWLQACIQSTPAYQRQIRQP